MFTAVKYLSFSRIPNRCIYVIVNRKVNRVLCFACNRLAAAKLNMETALEDAEYMAEELERSLSH